MSSADDRISRAVHSCVDRCYGKTPIGVIAEFLAELRQEGWRESDIRRVESAARHVLAGIIDPIQVANPFDRLAGELSADATT